MIRIPLYPLQSEIRGFMTGLEGTPKADYLAMMNTIWELTGTPQQPVEWLDPDQWIEARLTGLDRTTAKRLWEGSDKIVNPRHSRGAYWVLTNYGLVDEGPIYRANEEGRAFLAQEDSEPARRIDHEEGLAFLLHLTKRMGPTPLADMLEEWAIYCQGRSNIAKDSVLKDYLRRRMNNLEGRGLLERAGLKRSITSKGESYLSAMQHSAALPQESVADVLIHSVRDFNEKVKKDLRARLSEMDPHAFEKLVRDLMEAMGYEDVAVTSATNDKGVDVIGTVQFGITTVVEVIQVKRQKNNVIRPVLDALRGSLHRWKALRGTIITLSDFAKGCRETALDIGAAPITLINGDKLIDLLIEHQIAVKKRPLHYLSVDETAFEKIDDVADEKDPLPAKD
jgi:restriction system protein